MKYHINHKTGEIGPCRATTEGRGCPFGDLEKDHYPTEAIARQVYEYTMGEKTHETVGGPWTKSAIKTRFSEKDYLAASDEFLTTLSYPEYEALSLYVYDASGAINGYLGEGNPHGFSQEKLKDLIGSIDTALSKAPPREKVVWRALNDRPGAYGNFGKAFVEATYRPGETLTFDSYLSTAASPDKVAQYLQKEEGSNIVFALKTKEGAAVSSLRGSTKEAEYLLPRGKSFKILTVKQEVFAENPYGRHFNSRVVYAQEI